MTAITEEHAEFAVVERLGKLLRDARHHEYGVTQSYGLCVAILAWVMQRIRTPATDARTAEAKAAIALAETFCQLPLESSWVGVAPLHGEGTLKKGAPVVGWSTLDFLVWLRDACCHGDARQVSPINEGELLTGFAIKADRTRNSGQWFTLALTEEDLFRIGTELAERFCAALTSAVGEPHFADDARALKESRRAA